MASRDKLKRRLAIAFGAVLVLLLLSACKTGAPQSTFDPQGPVANKQLDLFKIIFWLAVAVFIVVEGLLVYSIIRFRRRPGQQGLPNQVHGNAKLEVVWTLIPVMILAAIAIPTYITIADQRNPPDDRPAITVNVEGHQWWWEYRYPEFGLTTANELHVPTGTVVNVNLRSADVVHSFWIPKLAGKTDVFPNRINKMWFVADVPGTFFGQCAELCGVGHANMRLRVVAQSPDDFQKWVAGQQQPPVPATGPAADGARVFAVKQCVLCHTNSGADADGVQEGREKAFEQGQKVFPAPNLTHFATRATFAGSSFEVNADTLRAWLENPDSLKPGNRMAQLAPVYHDPDLKLTNKDIDALMAYLLSRK